MSVLTTSAASPVGVLADGTPHYAPIGEVIVDGSLVTCHLCGRAATWPARDPPPVAGVPLRGQQRL